MNRTKLCPAVAALLLLIAACSQPPTIDTWKGQATNATGVTQNLLLEVEDRAGRWVGSYLVEAVRGSFDGTVATDGTLSAVLTAAPTCTFELTGTVTAGALTATFIPLDCPGGTTGTWNLTRQ